MTEPNDETFLSGADTQIITCSVRVADRSACSGSASSMIHRLHCVALQGPQGPPGGVGPMGSVGEKVRGLFVFHTSRFETENLKFYVIYVSCSCSINI